VGCLLIVILALFGGVGFLMPVTNTSMSVVDVIPTTMPSAQLGDLTAALSLDADGCPVEPSTTFADISQFFVAAPDSAIPAGTTLFVRLLRDGTPLEDSALLTADRDYQNVCVNFQFSLPSGNFDPASYEAILIVNGSEVDSISLTIE
jgi:hypothetical protein